MVVAAKLAVIGCEPTTRLLIEIVVPLVAFVTYFLIRGMLARVANDFHGCKGNLWRALRWAALWATVYTAPLVLIVWLAYVVHQGPVAR